MDTYEQKVKKATDIMHLQRHIEDYQNIIEFLDKGFVVHIIINEMDIMSYITQENKDKLYAILVDFLKAQQKECEQIIMQI